jgi:hypothetical protein
MAFTLEPSSGIVVVSKAEARLYRASAVGRVLKTEISSQTQNHRDVFWAGLSNWDTSIYLDPDESC